MKAILQITCCLVLLLYSDLARGQKLQVDIAASVISSKMNADSLYNGYLPSVTPGISIQYLLSDKVSLRAEPSYFVRNSRYKDGSKYEKLQFTSFSVPLLFQYKVHREIKLAAGPVFTIPIETKVKYSRPVGYGTDREVTTNTDPAWYFAIGADCVFNDWFTIHNRFERSLRGLPTQSFIGSFRFRIDGLFRSKSKERAPASPRYNNNEG